MATRTPASRLPDVSTTQLGWAALFVNLQLVFVVAYYAFTSAAPTDLRYAVYGLLWVNVGILAIYGTSAPEGVEFRTRRRALVLAAAYFGLLASVGGLVGIGAGEHATGFRIAMLPPGWGPAFVYAGSSVVFAITPAFLVGYLALAYLVYVTALETAGSAVAGLIGLFSCVSCTWPILAAAASALLGGAGILGTSALGMSYDLSTAVFLLTVGLLYWRPGIR